MRNFPLPFNRLGRCVTVLGHRASCGGYEALAIATRCFIVKAIFANGQRDLLRVCPTGHFRVCPAKDKGWRQVMMLRFCVAVASLLLAVTGASAADITVGFVTSLSGPGASIGIPYEKGILAADAFVSKVGDTNIKLIRLDDAPAPSAAPRAARTLV